MAAAEYIILVMAYARWSLSFFPVRFACRACPAARARSVGSLQALSPKCTTQAQAESRSSGQSSQCDRESQRAESSKRTVEAVWDIGGFANCYPAVASEEPTVRPKACPAIVTGGIFKLTRMI